MVLILTGISVCLLSLLPQYWVKKVFAKHQKNIKSILGTGGEFANHLLKKLNISGVKVIEQESSNYYDPKTKTLALSPNNYQGKSLCSVVIAAHEVGHVIQDYSKNRLLILRFYLIRFFQVIRIISNSLILIAPFLFAFRPVSAFLMVLIYFSTSIVGLLIHFCTFPLEWDASFNKALPILKKGGYIQKKQFSAAEQILKAAAFTYLAASLNNIIFSVFHWRGWRRR